MNSKLVKTGLMWSACLLSLVACASEETAMQSKSPGSSVSSAPTAAVAPGASETQGDSLSNCLSRIPKDSTAGSRMVAEESCRRNEAHREGIVGTATVKSGDRASAGTQGDSLEACKARIPKDATAGQRMLAEQTCTRDQTTHR